MDPFDRRGVGPSGACLVSETYVCCVTGVLDEGEGRVKNRDVVGGDYPFGVVSYGQEKLSGRDVEGGDVAGGTSGGVAEANLSARILPCS